MTLSLPPPADGACPQVRPLALRAEQAQELDRLRAGAPNQCGVRVSNSAASPGASTRSCSPSTHPQPAVEHVQPLVALVDLSSGFPAGVRAGMTILNAWMPPARRVSGTHGHAVRGGPGAGAPADRRSAGRRPARRAAPGARGPAAAAAPGSAGARRTPAGTACSPRCRWPSDSSARVTPRCRRSARSRGPTAASTSSKSPSTPSLPFRQRSCHLPRRRRTSARTS